MTKPLEPEGYHLDPETFAREAVEYLATNPPPTKRRRLNKPPKAQGYNLDPETLAREVARRFAASPPRRSLTRALLGKGWAGIVIAAIGVGLGLAVVSLAVTFPGSVATGPQILAGPPAANSQSGDLDQREPGVVDPVATTSTTGYVPPTISASSGDDETPQVLPFVVFPTSTTSTTSTTTPTTSPTTQPTPAPSTSPTPVPSTPPPTVPGGPPPTTTIPDTTPPTVTIFTPANGATFSQGAVVNAFYSCSDSGSGIASCVGTVANGSPINTSTLGARSLRVTARDNAGNTRVFSHSYTVVDTTLPNVTIFTPANGATFSQGAAVNASYSCSDSGSGIASCVGTVANGSPIDTSTPGARSLTVTARDNAGNTRVVSHNYTVVDTTPPTVTIFTPANGATFTQNAAVNASYSCSDSGSGIASCVGTVANGSPIDTSTPGARSLTVTARDNAGNTRVVTHNYTVVDTTPPTVTIFTPANGATFTQDAAVNASYSCSDSGSGIASCVGTVANGSPIDTSTPGARTFTVTAEDNAGNTTVVTHNYSVVAPADTTPPTVTINTPADDAVYAMLQVVIADYTCSDSGSGIASCVGTVANGSPINTLTPGARTFTVTAEDHAGNITVVTHRYRVSPLP